jgi:hypothetical protein
VVTEPPDVDPPEVELLVVEPPELEVLLEVVPVDDELDPSPHPASIEIGVRIDMAQPSRRSLVKNVGPICRVAIILALLDFDLVAITAGMAGQYGGNMRASCVASPVGHC